VETASRPSGEPSAEMARAVGIEKRLIRPEFQSQLSDVLLNSKSKWSVSDPLPPSAALPLVRGRRERSERGGRSHTILNWS
jgi:hypothetical protein